MYYKLKKSLEYLTYTYGPTDRYIMLLYLYLSDKEYKNKHGDKYTEAKYYRWNRGVFAREYFTVLEWSGILNTTQEENGDFTIFNSLEYINDIYLEEENFFKILDEVVNKWKESPQELIDYIYSLDEVKKLDFGERIL